MDSCQHLPLKLCMQKILTSMVKWHWPGVFNKRVSSQEGELTTLYSRVILPAPLLWSQV